MFDNSCEELSMIIEHTDEVGRATRASSVRVGIGTEGRSFISV